MNKTVSVIFWKRTRESEIAEVYEDNLESVISLCFNVLGNEEDALDVAQEAMLVLIDHWDEIESFARPAYWRTTAIRKCFRRIRQAQKLDSRNPTDIDEEGFCLMDSFVFILLSIPELQPLENYFIGNLTQRQLDIYLLLKKDLTSGEIQWELKISQTTYNEASRLMVNRVEASLYFFLQKEMNWYTNQQETDDKIMIGLLGDKSYKSIEAKLGWGKDDVKRRAEQVLREILVLLKDDSGN